MTKEEQTMRDNRPMVNKIDKSNPSNYMQRRLYNERYQWVKEVLESELIEIVRLQDRGLIVQGKDKKLKITISFEEQGKVSAKGNHYYRIRLRAPHGKSRTFSIFADEYTVKDKVFEMLAEMDDGGLL